MPIRAGFGFGENVGWASLRQAVRGQQISCQDRRLQWYARTNLRSAARVGPGGVERRAPHQRQAAAQGQRANDREQRRASVPAGRHGLIMHRSGSRRWSGR